MADNINLTPGSGITLRAEDIAGVKFQILKLDLGGVGVSIPLVGTALYGVPVDITRFPAGAVLVNNPTAANLKVDASGVAVPVTDNAGSITVDAPVGVPVFVRLSDGVAAIDTLPVTGTVAVTQSTPAAVASGWPVKLTDGTDTVGISTVGGAKALKVDVIQTVGGTGTSIADKAAFTEGTTLVTPIGGEFIAAPTDPSDGHAAAARITQKRALHVNIRANDGTELGIVATPLRVDPTGTTPQPVTFANQTIDLNKVAGTTISASNPVPVVISGQARTRVTKSIAITASQTAIAIWTPAGGKKFYIESYVLVLSAGGAFTLFDNTNAAANLIADGTWPITAFPLVFVEPWASATADNVLRYTSGVGTTGTLTVHGYEV